MWGISVKTVGCLEKSDQANLSAKFPPVFRILISRVRKCEKSSDSRIKHHYFFPPHTLKRVGKIIHPHIYSLFFWLSLPILCAHEMHRKTKENFPIHKTGYHKIFLLFYLYTNICIFRVWNCFSSQKFSTIKTSIYHYK